MQRFILVLVLVYLVDLSSSAFVCNTDSGWSYVQHNYPCFGENCLNNTVYAKFWAIGFVPLNDSDDATIGLNGRLVDESSACCSNWQTYSITDECSRSAIEQLVADGWDPRMYYIYEGVREWVLTLQEQEAKPCENNTCLLFAERYKQLIENCSIVSYLNEEVPATWICDPANYNSSDGCHCNCHAWDPDCDVNAESIEIIDALSNSGLPCLRCYPPGICSNSVSDCEVIPPPPPFDFGSYIVEWFYSDPDYALGVYGLFLILLILFYAVGIMSIGFLVCRENSKINTKLCRVIGFGAGLSVGIILVIGVIHGCLALEDYRCTGKDGVAAFSLIIAFAILFFLIFVGVELYVCLNKKKS